MPKPFNPELRTELLTKIVDHILINGLGYGVSLRPLAKAVHTSPRMLIYYFGSKELLMAEVVRNVRLREELDFVQAVAGRGDASKDCSAYMIPGLPLRERRTFGGYASVSMALRFSSQIPLQSP